MLEVRCQETLLHEVTEAASHPGSETHFRFVTKLYILITQAYVHDWFLILFLTTITSL
jgi:hypothetical protein